MMNAARPLGRSRANCCINGCARSTTNSRTRGLRRVARSLRRAEASPAMLRHDSAAWAEDRARGPSATRHRPFPSVVAYREGLEFPEERGHERRHRAHGHPPWQQGTLGHALALEYLERGGSKPRAPRSPRAAGRPRSTSPILRCSTLPEFTSERLRRDTPSRGTPRIPPRSRAHPAPARPRSRPGAHRRRTPRLASGAEPRHATPRRCSEFVRPRLAMRAVPIATCRSRGAA